jgi:hypothetical protein
MADAWKRRSRRPLKKTRAERRRVCERGVADRSIERESYGQQCERLAHFCAVGVCITGALAHRGLYARVSPFAFFPDPPPGSCLESRLSRSAGHVQMLRLVRAGSIWVLLWHGVCITVGTHICFKSIHEAKFCCGTACSSVV